MNFKKILVFIIFLFPCIVFAEEKVLVSCSVFTDKVSCSLSGISTDYEVVAIEAKVSFTNNLKLNGLKNSSLWNGDSSDNLISLYGIGTAGRSNFDIGVLTFDVINDTFDYGIVNFKQVKFADNNYKWHYLEDINTKFDVQYIENSEDNNYVSYIILFFAIVLIILLIFVALYCFMKLKKNNYSFMSLIKSKFTFIFLLVIFIIAFIILISKSSLFHDNKLFVDYTCTEYNSDEIKCELYGYSDYEIEAVEGYIENNTGLDIKFKLISDWNGDFDGEKFMLLSSDKKNNKFSIGDLFVSNFTVNSNKIKIYDIKFFDVNDDDYDVDDVIINLKEDYDNEKK